MRDVEAFATYNQLDDIIPLLKKGALIAQDPDNFEDITGEEAVTEEEKLALRDEVLHRWKVNFSTVGIVRKLD